MHSGQGKTTDYNEKENPGHKEKRWLGRKKRLCWQTELEENPLLPAHGRSLLGKNAGASWPNSTASGRFPQLSVLEPFLHIFFPDFV